MNKISNFLLGTALAFYPISAFTADITGVYQQNCVKCHGADGKGQTTVGKKFKVPDFTDSAWKSKTSDSKIKESIKNGVKDPGGKELMKAYKEKLSSEEIDEMAQYVRNFGSDNK